jgi:hypothetical protein
LPLDTGFIDGQCTSNASAEVHSVWYVSLHRGNYPCFDRTLGVVDPISFVPLSSKFQIIYLAFPIRPYSTPGPIVSATRGVISLKGTHREATLLANAIASVAFKYQSDPRRPPKDSQIQG